MLELLARSTAKVMIEGFLAASSACSAELAVCKATAVVLVALTLALVGCSTPTGAKHLYQTMLSSWREPGEKMVQTPGETQQRYGCVASTKKNFHLEEVEILPEVITAGKELNHRMRYALCAATPSETVKGQLTRTILYGGRPLFRDVAAHDFKPGTWVVDAFIGIPKEAHSGVYALETVIRYGNRSVKDRRSFAVSAK